MQRPNYGDTGATMGHELTHAFDDEGSQFDAQGNLRNWWTAMPTAKSSNSVRKCVDRSVFRAIRSSMTSRSTVKLTNGEDLADLGGTLLAYLAWKAGYGRARNWSRSKGLTPAQRFFIAYGQSWCTNERDENKRLRATVDPHSPEQYRANGVVANMN
jgi:putative endopeptidase